MKLIIVANRLPVKIVEEEKNYKITRSDGGLATGMNSLEFQGDTYWVGWAGMHLEDEKIKVEIGKELDKLNFIPVDLTPFQIENYYEGYSNSILWPLCHYFYTHVHYENKYWECYQEVNRLFCDAVTGIAEPGDIIWVQDYQLMLLPGLIRERIFDVSIGYFLHIPFPSYELFRMLPERAELLKGLLGADLIGFHTHDYMRHFISAVFRVLNLDCSLDEIQLDRRVVEVDAFPMGINYQLYYEAILQPEIKANAEEFRCSFGDNQLVVSVDRLDYSKGILIRLKAFECFLENHPEYHEKVSLVMIVSPSRDKVEIYADLKTEIDQRVGAINGKYSRPDWIPIHYFYRSFSFEEVTALYHIAEVALVTPLRDGMNLVAKEFLAAKRDQPGVLILSEMAGAATELQDAIIVNPNDVTEIENALLQALQMPEEEQMERLKNMQAYLARYTVDRWAKDFMEELRSVKKRNDELQNKIVEKTNFDKIKKEYDTASKRLIILDYDGTLIAFKNDAKKASPTASLIKLLRELSSDPKNRVVISSGRDKDTLERWLGQLPIGLAAEHGAFYKEEGEWHQIAKEIEIDDEILQIMQHTVDRTPRSKVELKKTAAVWHYREVDVWLAELRVNQLINALIAPCARLDLHIMKGNKIIEVKSNAFSKGMEAMRLVGQEDYDFIMAIGDDTTDEEMFQEMPEKSITIKVGRNSNVAAYNLPSQELTLKFLTELIRKDAVLRLF